MDNGLPIIPTLGIFTTLNFPSVAYYIFFLFHNIIFSRPMHCHAKTVQNGASSHKTNFIEIFSEILNLEGHLNRFIGRILPTGGIASGRVCPAVCAAGFLVKKIAS